MYAAVLIIFVLILIGVTIQRALQVKTKADFMLAGRKLAWPVLVFTLLSSWIGSGSFFAGAEGAFHNGFVALWIPAGGWFGLIIIYFVAARARRFAQYTVPDLLEVRYDGFVRVFGTLAILISYVGITSYQFIGGGDILSLIFPDAVTPMQGRFIIAAFVILFTALAGMSSVAYLDLVIGLLSTVTALVGFFVLLSLAGGWSGLQEALPPDRFTVFGTYPWYQSVNFFLPTFLLLLGNQTMYQKFFSAKTERDAKLSVTGWLIGILVLETVIIALAVVGSALYPEATPRAIIPTAARNGLPALFGALMLGGIFGQVISTANNFLFSPATNLIHDVYHRYLRPEAEDREILITSRIIVVLLGGVALFLAVSNEAVLPLMLLAYTVYGAAVTPVVMAAFFWKRANRAGALASVISGTVISLFWYLLAQPADGAGWALAIKNFLIPDFILESVLGRAAVTIDGVIPALLVSTVLLVGVSLVTAPPPEEKWRAVMAD
jgi:SSS family solute:Na+ symporter/sodium/proline symporter